MKNMIDPQVKAELLARIEQLTPLDPRQWGKMNVQQMICHLSDQLRDMQGIRPVPYQGSPFMRYIAKPVAFYLLPSWPKGALPTAPAYDPLLKGTQPTTFEADKAEFIRLFQLLDLTDNRLQLGPHPAFGPLTHKEYGHLIYRHFDHHLRQFAR